MSSTYTTTWFDDLSREERKAILAALHTLRRYSSERDAPTWLPHVWRVLSPVLSYFEARHHPGAPLRPVEPYEPPRLAFGHNRTYLIPRDKKL